MFTGLIETTAKIKNFQLVSSPRSQNAVLTVENILETNIGDSIAVNGCCLTVTKIDGDATSFELSSETLAATGLSQAKVGGTVNLERAMPANGRLGGHLVSGHVDCTGKISQMEAEAQFTKMSILLPKDSEPYLIPKGSICVDGISLTVNTLRPTPQGLEISLMLIPQTLQKTNLSMRHVLDQVNIEFDLVGKYIFRQKSLTSFLENSRESSI